MLWIETMRAYRKEHKLTQKDVAEQLGMNQFTYANYENGRRQPNIQFFEKLAHHFQLDLASLIEVELPDRNVVDFVEVPLVSFVTAGVPIEMLTADAELIPVMMNRRPTSPLFALRVKGDSMINAHIVDGDIVVVQQSPTAYNNEIVVASVDYNNATLKRYRFDGKEHWLLPENELYEPISINQEGAKIIGRVIQVIRNI
ncbi:MAG: LexA family protein [Culicoidibacterales bacterium]